MINGFHDEIDERTEQKKMIQMEGNHAKIKCGLRGDTQNGFVLRERKKKSNSINKKTIDNEVGGIRVDVGGEEIFRNNKKKWKNKKTKKKERKKTRI